MIVQSSSLYHKYNITKADGSPVDPDARYFILRIDTDPAAREVLLSYAKAIELENPLFADELRGWVRYHETPTK